MSKFKIQNAKCKITIQKSKFLQTFKFLLVFLTFNFYLLTFPAYAFEDIGLSKIHPAHPAYFLKGVRENLEMKFAQTDNVKNLRTLEFATRRLRETRALININQDFIPPALERYTAHLNSLSDKHQENDQFVPILQHNLQIHLQTMENIYHQASSPRARRFIRSAMNRVIQRGDVPRQTKLSICLLFAKEASSSALSQTEQYVLENRAGKCFSSLTQS